MKQVKHQIINFQSKLTDAPMEFTGTANGFYTISTNGDIMQPGTFAKDLPAFLEDGFIGGINHDWNHPIGKPIEASESASGLETVGKLSETDAGKEVYILFKDEVIKRLSIGYIPLGGEWLDEEKILAYWKGVNYEPSEADLEESKWGAFLMTRAKLIEYSPVMMPGNALTGISNVLSAPLAGRPLEDHLNSVLAADEELRDRIIPLLQKRSEEGRKLSSMWQARLNKLIGSYSDMLALAKTGEEETPEISTIDFARNKRMNDALAREYLVGLTIN